MLKNVVTFVIKRYTYVVTVYLEECSSNRGSNILVCNNLSSLHQKADARVQVRMYLYSVIHWVFYFAENNVQNASKGMILQVTTKSTHINAVALQALQHTKVSAAVD